MTCQGCARSVTKAIEARLPNVRAQVSLQNATVTIDGDHTEDVIATAVEEAGFTFGRAVS
jgi:copper chaperone